MHVYRRDGRLLQAYVAPLEGFEEAEHSREPSLLALFAQLRGQHTASAGSRRAEQRRHAVIKRLDERERKLRGELESLAGKRERAERREGLRAEGDSIFATLHELEPPEREAAKERAAELFSEYKKLGKSVPHITRRASTVARALEAVEALRWEAERASDEDLGDVEAAVAGLSARAEKRAAPAPRRRRTPLEFRTEDGSRIVVGRSPAENAEITFRVARPNDLWFHARGIPGAHVVLSRATAPRHPTPTSRRRPHSPRFIRRPGRRRRFRSITPCASTCASSAPRRRGWCGTRTPRRSSSSPSLRYPSESL